jgi:hypothetical protein
MTLSPFKAALTADCTSPTLQEVAGTLAAKADVGAKLINTKPKTIVAMRPKILPRELTCTSRWTLG